MKKIFFFVVMGMYCINFCLTAHELTALEQFAQTYAPPMDVIELLEKYKELVLTLDKRGVLKEIPNFFIKIEDTSSRFKAQLLHRVVNAERLRRCIEKYKLHLEVVKKYIYKLEGVWVLRDKKAIRLDGKWIVLAEKVNFKRQRLSLSLQEVQHLALLAEKTLYRDWGFARVVNGGAQYSGNNWVRNEKTGKLICIDTEDRSFEQGEGRNLSGKPLGVVFGYLSDDLVDKCDCDYASRRWLRKYKKSKKNVPAGLSLNHSTLYDSPDLDFEEVKRQWAIEYRKFTLEQERLRRMPPDISLINNTLLNLEH